MKLYRVVPDCFVTGQRLDATEPVASEALYYRMGYTAFPFDTVKHAFNNLNCEGKQGRYFYLFAEDALLEGSLLINNYHRLRTDTVLVLEYDMTEELVMKHIGYGDYTCSIVPLFLVEAFMEKNDFGPCTILSEQIKEQEKRKYLVEALKDSLQRIIEYGYSASSDMEYYRNLFWVENLAELDDETLKSTLLGSRLYYTFLNQPRELIPSPYITNRILPVNRNFMSYEIGNKLDEYYQGFGIKCDFSKEQREFKKELLYYLEPESQDKEKVKALLRERKYFDE